MPIKNLFQKILNHRYTPIVFFMVLFFVTACLTRPVFPIDETRYMSVAWEMFLNDGWLKPLTVNFEPYHHKPPFLFWMINISWKIFGVSHASAMLVVTFFSLTFIFLTEYLKKIIFPEIDDGNNQKLMLITMGTFPFLIFSTLIMFDIMLGVFVLLSFISLFHLKATKSILWASLLGLCMGLGILVKGPVIYLYVLPIALLAPLWIKTPSGFTKWSRWYFYIFISIIISTIPVLFWLIPVIQESSQDFAFWLLWNQTAGRIVGNFKASHVRPFWFYLPILPLFFFPWGLHPYFWKNKKDLIQKIKIHSGVTFLFLWIFVSFILLSLVRGKQGHYLIPLIPGFAIITDYFLKVVNVKIIRKIFLLIFSFFIIFQIIGAFSFFKRFNFDYVAQIVRDNPNRSVVTVGNSHGEIIFTARKIHHVPNILLEDLSTWFQENPMGMAVIRYDEGNEKVRQKIQEFKKIISHRYRGKHLGVFEAASN